MALSWPLAFATLGTFGLYIAGAVRGAAVMDHVRRPPRVCDHQGRPPLSGAGSRAMGTARLSTTSCEPGREPVARCKRVRARSGRYIYLAALYLRTKSSALFHASHGANLLMPLVWA